MMSYKQDTGSSRDVLEAEFTEPFLDFSRCTEGWNSKTGKCVPYSLLCLLMFIRQGVMLQRRISKHVEQRASSADSRIHIAVRRHSMREP